MNQTQHYHDSGDRLKYLFSTLYRYKIVILLPVIICTMVAAAYVLLKSNTWTARQSLVIRDDLVGQSYKPGRFDSLDAMKVAQETILDIARKPQVIRNALIKLGPPPSLFGSSSNWPSPQLIEETQGAITVHAPNGNELGTTEIFLLSVKSNTPERVRNFIEAILGEIESKAREIHQAKFASIENELQQQLNSAQSAFEKSANQLQSLESQIGVDLPALRNLNLEQGGDGILDRALIELNAEKRIARTEYKRAERQLELLVESRENPDKMLTTSSALLETQPRLNDLVKGLSDAQLELARQISEFSRSENHPKVKSGRQGILDIQKQIFREIDSSIESYQAQVDSLKQNLDQLVNDENVVKQRLTLIADKRVGYDKLIREVKKREEVLSAVRGDLAEVKAASSQGEKVNLLTRVDEPQVATRPDGLSKRATLFIGALGGFLIGFGLMMFVIPPYQPNLSSDDGESNDESAEETSRADYEKRITDFYPVESTGYDLPPVFPPSPTDSQLNPVVTRKVNPISNPPVVTPPVASPPVASPPVAQPVVQPVSQPVVQPTANQEAVSQPDLRQQQIDKHRQQKQEQLRQQLAQKLKSQKVLTRPVTDQKKIEEQLIRELQIKKKQALEQQKPASAQNEELERRHEASTIEIPVEIKTVQPDNQRPIDIARLAAPTDPIDTVARTEQQTTRDAAPTISEPANAAPNETDGKSGKPPLPPRQSDATMQLPPSAIDDEFSKFFNDNPSLPEN